MEPRLLKHYKAHARPRLAEQFQWGTPHRIPKVETVVVNLGVGAASKNAKLLTTVVEELGVITGQKAVITLARKSISNFQLRKGMRIGASVTLRRSRMYEFLDRLVSIVIPRVRDFRGLRTRAFDGRGNFTMGVREQIIFPEIDYDKVDEIRGFDVVVVTTAKTDEEGRALLAGFGMPFPGGAPA